MNTLHRALVIPALIALIALPFMVSCKALSRLQPTPSPTVSVTLPGTPQATGTNVSLTPTPGSDKWDSKIVNTGLAAKRFLVSPDGAFVALCTSEKAAIWSIRLSDASRQQVGNAQGCTLAWRPRSHELLILQETSAGSGVGAIMLADQDKSTGAMQTLVSGGVRQFEPSPDGTRVAYQTGDGGPLASLWIMNLTDSTKVLVTSGALGWFGWSPDGQALLYEVNTQIELKRGRDSGYLVRYDLASGRYLHVSPDFQKLGQPYWSPDGRWIGLNAMPGGAQNLSAFVVMSDGLKLHSLMSGPPLVIQGWSADGTRILFSTNDPAAPEQGLWQNTVDHGTNTLVTKVKGSIEAASMSPDGKLVAVLEGKQTLTIISTDGTAAILANDVAAGDLTSAMQWLSPTVIAYLTHSGDIRIATAHP